MKNYFVTGTDTGVGKTLVSRLMIQYFVQLGFITSGFKPVASGARQTQLGLRNEDAEILLAASNAGFSYDQFNPYVFEKPIAPHIAAMQNNTNIDISYLTQCFQQLTKKTEVLIVEGAGGWQVPLNNEASFADWVEEMQWPVILVVGLRLGCINHAMLSYRDIFSKGNHVAGWVANSIDENITESDEIIQYLQSHIHAPLIGVIPHLRKDQFTHAGTFLDFSRIN